jgi:outer membrane receptor protein involved in Fe transport
VFAAWLAAWPAVPSLAPPAAAQEAAAGALRGTVYDRDFGAPLDGARVSIAEALLSVTTSANGNFLFERVPPGSYTVIVARQGYEKQLVTGVVVAAGQIAELRVEMASEVIEMEELVVTGADLLGNSELGVLEIRAAAVASQDAVSSELIGKAGASDVAGALKLVVGASVVDGKYATVRGLSDRYTGTTLDGVRVPSADPRRRAVQVDLFPTGTIESVTVTKTFTPDLHGDFTGGGIDIRTKSIPDGFTLTGSTSVEHNSLATGNEDFLTYEGGGVDFTAHDDGGRTQPGFSKQRLPAVPTFPTPPPPAQTAQQLLAAAALYDRLTRSFTPVMGVSRDEGGPGPNTGFQIVAGNRVPFGAGRVLGVLGALTWQNKFDFYDGGANNTGSKTDPTSSIGIEHERVDSEGTEEVLIGALATFVVRPTEAHELALRLVGNQGAEDEARLQIEDLGGGSLELNQALRFTERTLLSAQLHGGHQFGKAWQFGGETDKETGLDWLLSWNLTQQEEPDARFFRNTFDVDTLTHARPIGSVPDADLTRRIWRDIDETNVQGAVDFSLPFLQWSNAAGTIKAGVYAEKSEREYSQNQFFYQFPTQNGGTPLITNDAVQYNRRLARYQASGADELWTDVFLDPERIGFANNRYPQPGLPSSELASHNQLLWIAIPRTDDADYDGEQEIAAAYAMADLPLTSRLKAIFGARREATRISVVPFNSEFGLIETIEVQPSGDRAVTKVDADLLATELDEQTLLPSVGAVWEPIANMNVRASWSRTLARPTFRELAPVAAEEFLLGDEFFGNPDLALSKISNYDLRWEWFRRPGDVLAVSGFYKDLRDPIEHISFSAGGRTFIQPINYETGKLRGVELEVRTGLDAFTPPLEGFGLGLNYTLIESEVEVPQEEQDSLSGFGLQEKTRRLQGQPEYLFNASLTFDSPGGGTSVGVFYNRIGETLLTGAARGLNGGTPNVFEEAYATLDVTFSQKIGKRWLLSAKARNLLRPERRTLYRAPDGEEQIKTERDSPLLLSVALSAKW